MPCHTITHYCHSDHSTYICWCSTADSSSVTTMCPVSYACMPCCEARATTQDIYWDLLGYTRNWAGGFQEQCGRRHPRKYQPSLLGSTKFTSKLNWRMNTPESCSFWVTDTGNISFSTQIHCFHQVLASWLSSISLQLLALLTTTGFGCGCHCHTAHWHSLHCRR